MISRLTRRKLLASAACTVVAAGAPALAAGQAANAHWPTRPVRLIVGFPGGSSPDLVARTLAEPLAKLLGQPVVVENKVGAGGNIGAEAVAHATDNHTLGLMINGNMTIAKLINPKATYDPLKDLQPVSLVATAPLALAASAHAPGATAAEFFAAARASGDRWSYGSPGIGTVAHIGMELLKARAGIAPVHIPYPGNPQVINGIIGEQIQLALLPPAMAAAQARAGKLRVIGVTSSSRSSLVPEYPSLSEAGIANYQMEIWNAVAAPRSMPQPLVQRLGALLSEIARSPEIRAKLFAQGWQVAGTSSEGLANRIRNDAQVLGEIIRSQKITAQ